jgi:hypothetical protein
VLGTDEVLGVGDVKSSRLVLPFDMPELDCWGVGAVPKDRDCVGFRDGQYCNAMYWSPTHVVDLGPRAAHLVRLLQDLKDRWSPVRLFDKHGS